MGIPQRIALPRTRVAIINDQPWLCDAMQAVLQQSGVLQVTGSGGCDVALDTARSSGANVLLVILDGDATSDRAMLDALPAHPVGAVILLSAHTTPSHVDTATRLAFSVVRHTQSLRDIVDQLLLAGGAAHAPAAVRSEDHSSALSDFDRRLIRLIAAGVPLSRIAELLEVSRTEAWDRLIAVLDLFQLCDRVQLAAYAMSHGLVEWTPSEAPGTDV